MSRLFDSILGMPAPFNMVVLIVLIASVAGVISSIAKEVRKYLCHREDMELRREMLYRGMDEHEIENVMQASASHTDEPSDTVHSRSS